MTKSLVDVLGAGLGDSLEAQVDLGELGRVRIVGIAGEGGYGKTFVAESADSPTKRFALKVIRKELAANPEVLKSFETEARALALLDSPNIVGVIAAGVEDGFPWIATELVDGPSLWEMLQSGALQTNDFCQLALDLCRALVDAHESNVSHNDIKPPNILFDTKAHRFVLIDYGIGRFQRIRGVRHNEFLGTPFYAAPEQHRGRSVAVSDVYSAGVVLLEAMSGSNRLEDAANDTAVAEGVSGIIAESERVTSIPVDLAGVPAEYTTILEGMLDRDPVARFTAIETRHRWESALGETTTLAPIPTPVPHSEPVVEFESGKIAFRSWQEVEETIRQKFVEVGISNFTLDVNTTKKFVVNVRVSEVDGDVTLVMPATANKTNMRTLGWRVDPIREVHELNLGPSPTNTELAHAIVAALQIGFGIQIGDVTLLI